MVTRRGNNYNDTMSISSLQVTDDVTQEPVRARTWLSRVVAGLLFLAVWVGLLLWRMNSADSLQVAVEQAGGWYYTWDQSSLANRALGTMLGQPTRFTNIRFCPGQVSDDWLLRHRDLLASAPNLTLFLQGTRVNGEGLEVLHGNSAIHYLDLYKSPVSDTCLQGLSHSKGLYGLNIARTKITDQGLQAFHPGREFNIALDSTQLTDTGVQNLQTWGPLWGLTAYGVDDATLQRIQQLQFSYLTIYQDDEQLKCSHSEVTRLLQARSLRHLTMIGTNFTEQETEALQEVQPSCLMYQMTVDEYESQLRNSKPVSRLRLW